MKIKQKERPKKLKRNKNEATYTKKGKNKENKGTTRKQLKQKKEKKNKEKEVTYTKEGKNKKQEKSLFSLFVLFLTIIKEKTKISSCEN